MSRSDRFDRDGFGARYATSPWAKNGQPYQPVVQKWASRSGLDSQTSGRTQVAERFR